MAMTKKEQAFFQEMRNQRDMARSFSWSDKVQPDINEDYSNVNCKVGYVVVGSYGYSMRVEKAISWQTSHYIGREAHEHNPDSRRLSRSKNSISMYSTELLALKALRGKLVEEFSKELLLIDQRIERISEATNG